MGYNSLMPIDVNNQTILFCSNGDLYQSEREDLKWTASPIMCLSEATQNSYDAIIIYIKESSLVKAASMIELCSILKKNHHTCDYPVVAVCTSVNRRIVEQLVDACVDYVLFEKDLKGTPHDKEPSALINELKDEIRPEKVLARLCPYIHYAPINDDKELITCKAYANWLVLRPRILRELCETPHHLSCQYYQSPRLPQ